jgi:hypothetical protein
VRLTLRPDTAQLWVMTAVVAFTALAALWLRLSRPPARPQHRRLEDEPLAWWDEDTR